MKGIRVCIADIYYTHSYLLNKPKREPIRMSLLKVEGLGKSYTADKQILKNINFEIKQENLFPSLVRQVLVNLPLLRCINRMVEFNEGKIIFNHHDVGSLNKKELRKLRTNIGMIFQHYNLVPRLTVIENVLHGRFGYKTTLQGILGRYTEEEKERAFYLLEKLGIHEHAYKRCDQLSGGQQQRVGICRALIQEPKLVLCDEPIASLDPSSSKIIMDHLKSITVRRWALPV